MSRDLRRSNKDTKEKLSYKETLEAMCKCYGSFCGRWHSNEFWKNTLDNLVNMTEEQCENKIREIEDEANSSLEYWRAYQ